MAENTSGPLRIVQLYPRDMNIYGDWGNTLVLARRAQWQGYDVELLSYDPGDELPGDIDILVGGGGQDSGQFRVMEDLQRIKPLLLELVQDGAPMLAICGLYQLFGHRFRTIGGETLTGVGIFAGSIWSATLLPTEFIPASDIGRSQIQVELPPGATIDNTEDAARRLSAQIDEVPEVQSVFVYSDGSDVTEARVMINYGKKETRERSQFVLEEELKQRLSGTPDMRINFQNENGQNDLTINVLGATEEGAALAAERLATAMSQLPSLESVTTTARLQRPEIQITPRADVAAQLGVSASDMATTLRVATLGDVESNLAKFNAGDEQIPIVVRLNADARADHLDQRGQRTAVQQFARAGRAHVAKGQRLIAKAVPLLKQQKPHLVQLVAAGDRLVAVAVRAHQDEAFGKQRHFGQARVRDGQRQDHRVKLPLAQFVQQAGRHRLAQAEFQIGEARRQLGDDPGQQIGGDGRNDADAQPPRQVDARGPGQVVQFVHAAQDVAGAFGEKLAKGRHPQPAAAAFEQGHPDGFLKLLDLHGQGRLGNRAVVGGASEMAVPRQRIEIAQLPEGNVHHKTNLSD